MIPPWSWRSQSTAPVSTSEHETVRVTHPFHPWFTHEFVFVRHANAWSQDRVFFFGHDGSMQSLPTSWTDFGEPDVFVARSAGRSAFRVQDLLDLLEIMEGIRGKHV